MIFVTFTMIFITFTKSIIPLRHQDTDMEGMWLPASKKLDKANQPVNYGQKNQEASQEDNGW